jgi:hypothetical protein
MNRYIQQKPILPVKKKETRKNEISKPNSYNQKVMESAKPIYTGRGKV